MRKRGLLVVLIFSALAFYLAGNNAVALWDRDEPRYAQTSRQMLQSGDWVVPHLYDQVRYAKPPFIYWCQAIAMKFLGENSFAARLPSAIAITLTLIVFYSFVKRVRDERHAVWSCFILATSALTIAAAKMCLTDGVLLLWITLGQIAIFQFLNGNASWWWVIVYGVSTGLAGITKGPVVLGVQAMTLIVYFLIRLRNSHGLEARATLHGWLKAFAAIIIIGIVLVPWLIEVTRRQPDFIKHSLSHDVVERSTSGLEGHKGPPGYYLLTVWGTFFPWSLLIPAMVVYGIKIARNSATKVALPGARFAIAAVVGPWIMFEIVATKLPHYLLPVFPWLALLAADVLLAGSDRLRLGWRIGGGAFAACVLIAYLFIFPNVQSFRLSPRIGGEMQQLGARDAIMMDYKEPSLAFYQGGTIRERREDFLDKTPLQNWPTWIVITRKALNKQPSDVQQHLQIVDSFGGIAYADKLRWVEVLLAKKKP